MTTTEESEEAYYAGAKLTFLDHDCEPIPQRDPVCFTAKIVRRGDEYVLDFSYNLADCRQAKYLSLENYGLCFVIESRRILGRWSVAYPLFNMDSITAAAAQIGPDGGIKISAREAVYDGRAPSPIVGSIDTVRKCGAVLISGIHLRIPADRFRRVLAEHRTRVRQLLEFNVDS